MSSRTKKTETSTFTDEELRLAWNTWERLGHNNTDTAEALGLSETSIRRRIKAARERFNLTERSTGSLRGTRAKSAKLPKRGEVKRYIFTCIQNNTRINEAVWASLTNLATHYEAEIHVATFTYTPQDGGSVKRGSTKNGFGYKSADRWYDVPEELISDEFIEIAPGLVWCGHSNRLPTAQNPLSGVDSINGRASGIWPHTTIQMRPVATMHGEDAKFNFTTGTIGLKNYMQKFAGQRAEFHHAYGGLLVEVCSDGTWFARQLNADSEGVIYDLGIFADPAGVYEHDGIEALVLGDIHRAKLDEAAHRATFGEGRMVDALRPKKAVYHDLLDFESRRHHSRKDPHERFRVYVEGRDSVLGELIGAGEYLDETQRPGMEQIVIRSNHDRDLDRWLRETDWRDDLVNAEFYLEANMAMLKAIRARDKDFNIFEWAVKHLGYAEDVYFNPLDRSIVVCPEYGGGVELGLHGDEGPNGAHGTPAGLAKIGRKIVIGDKHAPGIWDGCYVAGVLGSLEQGYNTGPSGWAHANVPVYDNGKRQVLLIRKGAYSADDYVENVL